MVFTVPSLINAMKVVFPIFVGTHLMRACPHKWLILVGSTKTFWFNSFGLICIVNPFQDKHKLTNKNPVMNCNLIFIYAQSCWCLVSVFFSWQVLLSYLYGTVVLDKEKSTFFSGPRGERLFCSVFVNDCFTKRFNKPILKIKSSQYIPSAY